MLKLRLLGEMEVLRADERIALPPSRKTRALLAYLIGTGRPQRRERLCDMFWDIPDDPRGALRWSMSKLRAVVDEPGSSRIVADRETAAFDGKGADIDLVTVRALGAGGIQQLPTEKLEEAASLFRGEFLEGLDLPDQHDFQSWCVAEREELRRTQIEILSTLIERHAGDAEGALPAARQLVQVDPFNETARADLLQLMFSTGRRREAESHFETAQRLFKDIGAEAQRRLEVAWRSILRRSAAERPVPPPPPPAEFPPADVPAPGFHSSRLVGRKAQLQALAATLDEAIRSGTIRIVEVTGDAGIGKSRLLRELKELARSRGVRTLLGRSYDFRIGAAYGPWMEAIGEFPALDTTQSASAGRERLFSAVTRSLVGDGSDPVLLVMDDIQWGDEASADLLHHVAHAAHETPLMLVLAARAGELRDNRPITSVLRSLRQDGMLQTLKLEPLSAQETDALVRAAAPEGNHGRIVELSGGNPLYASELARGLAENPAAIPGSLKEIVRDRVERLPPAAADLLRWASVLGPTVGLEAVRLATELELDRLASTLELLERHGILVPADDAVYTFSHELVRRAIYTGLSEPRRRLMHLKIARLLSEHTASAGARALDIAHHAAAGGDAWTAAESCVSAGRRCMRLFAHADAMAMVRRGQRYAEGLPEPDRTERLIELTEIECAVSRPDRFDDLISRIEQYAETALDHGRAEHARRCYTMLAAIRWEGGAWSDAQRDTLRGELVSRSIDDCERVLAMAEASRCLAMLERDLGTAEELALEAEALARRLGNEPNAIFDALGLLSCYRGEYAEAARLFERARIIARRDGDRISEFVALEHLLTLRIEQGRMDEASHLCREAVDLAARLRPGSEAPFVRALHALCTGVGCADESFEEFDQALADLRAMDAKHRLAFVASAAAHLLLLRGNVARARALAEEALSAATILDRNSDIAVALSGLVRIETFARDEERRRMHEDRLVGLLSTGISKHAQDEAEAALASGAAELFGED